ncbi:LolA family protein [Bowmanella dokdonensis]|uniref:DUF2092 domain-containing protein n=1 Tax=Bowmanella dokdonensis TaxID=751969 RepID=A0A939ILJ8_9ALTE|nr:hypothetical protein [Bowmanella dokdonensis]MBN7824293.1 hypothetical protein [Bowmanella dokdonensis]
MKSTDSLEQHVQQFKAQQPSDVMTQAAMARLQARLSAEPMAESPHLGLWQQINQWIKRSVRIPTWQVGGSLATVGLIALLYLGGGASHPAFAEVVEKLKQISTLQYTGTMYSNGQATMKLRVYYQAPSLVRTEFSPAMDNLDGPATINLMDTASGKGLILMPGPMMALPFDFGHQDSPEDDPLYWLEALKQYQGEVVTRDGGLIDGQATTLYRIEQSGVRTSIWAANDSQWPLKVIVTASGEKDQEVFKLEADLTFNQPLSPELFDFSAPGYHVGQPD